MIDSFERVCKWYEARKDQVFDADLVHSLLVEEYQEWVKTDSQVGEIKELCDIVFVAMGGIWALNEPEEELTAAQNIAFVFGRNIYANRQVLWPGYYIGALIDQHAMNMVSHKVSWLQCIIQAAMMQLQIVGLTSEQCIEVFNIVCKSNEAKSITKIPKGQKYSEDGKGPYYRPAEPELRKFMRNLPC